MRFWILLFLACFLAGIPQGWAFARKLAAVKTQVPQVKTGKKYACPMFCQISDKPGKCPKCGMEMWEVSP